MAVSKAFGVVGLLVLCALLGANVTLRPASHVRRLLQVKSQTQVQGSDPSQILCMLTHAAWQMAKCVMDKECNKALQCVRDAQALPDDQMCPAVYVCQMAATTSKLFTDYVAATFPCLKSCPMDGTCLATDADAVQNITSLDQIEGDWWVTRGINCGQGSNKPWATLNPTPGKKFPGAYDWLPCQHERIVRSTGRDYPHATSPWVNNITYCGGRNGGMAECTSPVIDTVANISLKSPGVMFHQYTDAPTHPQEEYWRIISRPHPDYMLVLWCGSIRVDFLKYAGGIALARGRKTEKDMPAYVAEAHKKAAARFGVSWDHMCPSTNEGCP